MVKKGIIYQVNVNITDCDKESKAIGMRENYYDKADIILIFFDIAEGKTNVKIDESKGRGSSIRKKTHRDRMKKSVIEKWEKEIDLFFKSGQESQVKNYKKQWLVGTNPKARMDDSASTNRGSVITKRESINLRNSMKPIGNSKFNTVELTEIDLDNETICFGFKEIIMKYTLESEATKLEADTLHRRTNRKII